jgi:hypothetical protein
MKKFIKYWFIAVMCFIILPSFNTPPSILKIGLLKYNGGGDWYANPTALPNLAKFCNEQMGTNIELEQQIVEVGSTELFDFAFIHTTGHGNITFNEMEAQNMRNYLVAGGFWHIDDNYGMDPFVRPVLKKIFPELELIELPFNHKLYHQQFNFNNGLPKIHEHDNGAPKGYGLIYQGRVVVFYSFETDLGDGWEDPTVHKDPIDKHTAALQMGANLVQYAFTN